MAVHYIKNLFYGVGKQSKKIEDIVLDLEDVFEILILDYKLIMISSLMFYSPQDTPGNQRYQCNSVRRSVYITILHQ